MKKLLSLILVLSFVLSSFSIGITAFAFGEVTVNEFVENLEQIYDVQEENDITLEDAVDCRIIVKSSKKPNVYNAEEFAKGTDGIYIYQYTNKRKAEKALEYFRTLNYVEWAEFDSIMEESAVSPTYGDSMMQFEEARKYIDSNNITSETITVAVVDSGALFNSPLLDGRVVDSGINTSNSGVANSAKGDSTHGTYVSSVIVNSTNENVVIRAYKVLNAEGKGSTLSVSLGIAAAIEDNVDVINLSLGGVGYQPLLHDVIEGAQKCGIMVVCSAGNDNVDTEIIYPAAFDDVITVGAIDRLGNRSYFSNYGDEVDFVAPGHELQIDDNKIINGTSFSSPFVAAAVAMVLTVAPNMTKDEVYNCLKKSCIPYEELIYHDGFHAVSAYNLDNITSYGALRYDSEDERLYYGNGMPQITTAVEIAKKIELNNSVEPRFSHESGVYNDKFDITIEAPDGYSIYYTTDESYPSRQNGELYTQPITIDSTTSIRAVTYSEDGIRSTPNAKEFKIEYLADESDFEINSDGFITEYNGTLTEIVIPNLINDIVPRGVASEANNSCQKLVSITFPETVREIESFAFEYSKLKFVKGDGLEKIGEESFLCCEIISFETPNITYIGDIALGRNKIYEIYFPELTEAGDGAFADIPNLQKVHLPKLKYVSRGMFEYCEQLKYVEIDVAKTIDQRAFQQCAWLNTVVAPELESTIDTLDDNLSNAFLNCMSLQEINFPKLTNINGYTFFDCINLNKIILPNAKNIGESAFKNCQSLSCVELPNVEHIGNDVFVNTMLTKIDLPKLKSIGSYVFAWYNSMYKNYYENEALLEFNSPKLQIVADNAFAYTSSLKELDLPNAEALGENVFKNSGIQYLYAPKLEKTGSFPTAQKSKVILSSKFTECTLDATDYPLTIYGTTGTYAEEYANKYDLNFVCVPVIITQPAEEFNDLEASLMVEAAGFDVTYQWYANDENNDTDGTPIEGATGETFYPLDYEYAKYYYCVATSYEEDGTPIQLKTIVVKNSFAENEFHIHEYILTVTPPTCTEKGYTTYVCSICGDSYVDDYIDALGHFQGRVVVVDATAVKDGSKTIYCAVCDEVISSEIIKKAEGKVVATIQSNGKTILTGAVNSDYSAYVTVPHGAIINAGKITGVITMTDVESLGVEGTKSYEKTILTGVEKTVELDNYLPDFNSASIVGRIDGIEYGYNLVGVNTEDHYTINAVPQEETEVKKAWQALTSHMTTTEKSAEDSYVIIPGKAYVQIGTEKLTFEDENDTLKIDNLVQGGGIKSEIKSSLKLETTNELEVSLAEIFLPAGTVLALGQTEVTLSDDATIRISGYEESSDVNEIMSKLRDCSTNEEIIKTIVLFVSDVSTAIEGKTLTVDVEFAHIAENDWTIIERATCAEEGLQVKYCTMCGQVIAEEVISATGHNYEKVVTKPTCAEKGYTTFTCSVCGDTYVDDYVDELGHTEEIISGKPATSTETGLTDGKKCSVCGVILQEQEIIPIIAFTISGTIETFDDGVDNSDITKIELIPENQNEMKYSVEIDGSGENKYSISNVAVGTYTVRVSKENHVTRECVIEVKEDTRRDLKIHLRGDIDGDGKVKMNDMSLVNAHIKETIQLDGYALICADVTGDGKVKMNDMNRINAHIKETSMLW